jgi:hypothetical protein
MVVKSLNHFYHNLLSTFKKAKVTLYFLFSSFKLLNGEEIDVLLLYHKHLTPIVFFIVAVKNPQPRPTTFPVVDRSSYNKIRNILITCNFQIPPYSFLLISNYINTSQDIWQCAR